MGGLCQAPAELWWRGPFLSSAVLMLLPEPRGVCVWGGHAPSCPLTLSGSGPPGLAKSPSRQAQELAFTLAQNWVRMNLAVYETHQAMFEKVRPAQVLPAVPEGRCAQQGHGGGREGGWLAQGPQEARRGRPGHRAW